MRKMFRKGGTITCLTMALVALLSGCDDECSIGKSECKKGNVLRTCVATDDGNQWVYNQCGSNEACVNAEDLVGDAGDDVSGGDAGAALVLASLIEGNETNSVTAACIGTCAAGEHECLGPTTSRLCAGDGVWQIIPCEFGQECLDGVCKVSTGPNVATRCTPDAKACASDKVAKVCNPDGTEWTEVPCAMNETCTDTECVPDAKSSCDDMNMCIDSTTAARCKSGGQGFDLVECPKGTWCEGGNCQGTACVLGKTCNGANQIRDCKDGSEFVDIQCGANEVCQQLKDDAMCVPQACTAGTTQCGDPRDSKVDPTKQFTTCVVDPAGSALNRWVTGTCEGETSCNPDPTKWGTATTPCTQDCTPKAKRCATFVATGVSNGVQECDKNGKWGPVENCNKSIDTVLVCADRAVKPGELPDALCAEPVCAQVLAKPKSATGFCQDGKLVSCLDDGTLADKPVACDVGICQDGDKIVPDPDVTYTPIVGIDGRMPGMCTTATECKDGEEQCLGGSTFQTCVKGFWSTLLSHCDKDAFCRNTVDGDGLRGKFCGGDCAPGSRSCNGTAPKKVFTCGKDGKLDDGVKCDLGYCAATGSDAACVVDCIPGTFMCVGAGVIAPDGFHAGTAMEMECGSDGTFGAATACPATTACRTSDAGIDLGCIQCIGPDVPAGNAENRADSRCAPNDPTGKIQDCKPTNEWDTARACGGATTCAGPYGVTCGYCNSAAGFYGICNEARINDAEVCGACDADGGGAFSSTASPCTPTNINTVNAGNAIMTAGGCADAGLGAPSMFGGVLCCTGGAHRTGTASCTTLGEGAPTSAGTYADCCGLHVVASSGVSFAACYEP